MQFGVVEGEYYLVKTDIVESAVLFCVGENDNVVFLEGLHSADGIIGMTEI